MKRRRQSRRRGGYLSNNSMRFFLVQIPFGHWKVGMLLSAVFLHCCWGDTSMSSNNTINTTLSMMEDLSAMPFNNNLSLSTGNTTALQDLQRLRIAGLYDLTIFPDWPLHLMQFTIHLINNKRDGWYDDVLPDAIMEGTMNDSACDPDIATRAYLGLTRDVESLPAAIYGCRCSGASMAVARLCGIENIAMMSPYASSGKLSNEEEYPTFSRTAGPDNEQGQVGALISLLKAFGWDRISVINTDTQFTKDIALELSNAWKGRHENEDGTTFVGEIGYTDTIKLNGTTNEVDPESVRRVLKGVPVTNPEINSRIIVLFAHHQHSYPILKQAQEMHFQPDTIWMGVSEWIDRDPVDGDSSWMPDIPGYIGLAPYRNLTSPYYKDYLARLQQYEWRHGLPLTENLYDFAADKIVDGMLALAMAFSAVPKDQRQDGRLVSEELRKLQFNGVSGPIAFQPNGDFLNPRFTVKTLRSRGLEWTDAGFVTPGTAHVDFSRICYPVTGCVDAVPNDEYPEAPEDMLPFWVWVILACLIFITILLYHQRLKNRSFNNQLQRIENELQALDNNNDAVKARKGRLYKEVASLLGQPTPEHWTEHHGLVNVPPTQQEYWDVLHKLRETMNDNETCHLSQLSRVQNIGIWSYYVFRKNQLVNKYGVDMQNEMINEVSVWHGTSSLNPDVIYNDRQDGFMMQLSQQGQWGRGIYFSERSGYSDPYAFKPMTKHSDDVVGQDRELFLVKLLVGESVFLDRNEGEWMREACRNLVRPPDNPARNGLKFDTVKGEIDDEKGTNVYVVYENGRAYPEYLVRYYKGPRDKERTPHETLDEALEGVKSRHSENTPVESAATTQPEEMEEEDGGDDGGDNDDSSSVVSGQAIWQFEDDKNQWINYLEAHQIQIEQAYQHDPDGITTIEHFPWTYIIDFTVNTQTNLDHPDKTSRKVRRIKMLTQQLDDRSRSSNRTRDNQSDTGSNKSNALEPQSEKGARHGSWQFALSQLRLMRYHDSGSDDDYSYWGNRRFQTREARTESEGRGWAFRLNPLDSGSSTNDAENHSSWASRLNPLDSFNSNHSGSRSGGHRWYRWIHRQDIDDGGSGRRKGSGSWFKPANPKQHDSDNPSESDGGKENVNGQENQQGVGKMDVQDEQDNQPGSDQSENSSSPVSSEMGGIANEVNEKVSLSDSDSKVPHSDTLSDSCRGRHLGYVHDLESEVHNVSTRMDRPLQELIRMIDNAPNPIERLDSSSISEDGREEEMQMNYEDNNSSNNHVIQVNDLESEDNESHGAKDYKATPLGEEQPGEMDQV
ncbi:polymerase 11 [Seminavis robusta]|uniref:Polymerase 11 n=1 Tax=Seminavis robusta TaxID=568900 RepID=A0A9N8EZC2_9STRA|nr:polymerase 11 [Seminavis robusta]|eukprot:Sro2652_g333710.1 polymerase 11 (1293) ;mRNA; f:5933-9811